MIERRREARRSRKALIDAAVVFVVPTVIVVLAGLLAGGYFLRKEINARETDRAEILVHQSEARAEILAKADANLKEAFRKVICRIQRTSVTSRQRTAEEKAETIRFYNQILREDLSAPPCPVLPPH